MDKKLIQNIAFGLVVLVILLLGFSLTVGPSAADLRQQFVKLLSQPGSPFRFLFRDMPERPEATEAEAASAAPDETEQTEEDGLDPGETPLLDFEEQEFDTEYGVPGNPEYIGPTQEQDRLPDDILVP